MMYNRFQVKPNIGTELEIYNYLTGNEGRDKDSYGNTVITAVWNMEPYDFLAEGSKHNDYWYRSRNSAPEVVAEYMDKYFKYAKKNKIEIYKQNTRIEKINCW